MRTTDTGGFTIIEVMIFLAITALMITIALIGTGNSIRSARFTDSVRSFESFMQRQFDEVLNGVNPRTGDEACNAQGLVVQGTPTAPGTSNNCLLLGKYVHVTKGSSLVEVYYVVGTDPGSLNRGESDAAAIAAAKPRVVKAAAVQQYDIPWQASIYGAKREDGRAVDGVAMLRSPISSSIYTYTLASPAPPDDLTPYLIAANANRQTNICVRSQDNLNVHGAITLARNGRGQDAISARIDIENDGPNGLEALCEGAA